MSEMSIKSLAYPCKVQNICKSFQRKLKKIKNILRTFKGFISKKLRTSQGFLQFQYSYKKSVYAVLAGRVNPNLKGLGGGFNVGFPLITQKR